MSPAVPTLMEAIDPGVDAATVVLDHVEAVVNRECQYVLTEFALRLPPGWQVVMASRHALPLPLARLRLQARLVELDAQDLAMSPDEAAALLDRAGGGVGGGAGRHPRRADRRLADRALLRRAGPADGRPAGHRDQLRRGGPVPGRLPAGRAVRPALAGRDRVPGPDVGGGAALRAAVRRDRRRRRLGPPAGGAGTAEPAGDPAGPAPRVVPLPPPVPGPAAGRAAPQRARAGAAAAPARGRLAGGELPAGRGRRARPGGRRRRSRRPAGPRPDAAGLGERAGRDRAALDDLVRPGPRDRALPGDRRCTAR